MSGTELRYAATRCVFATSVDKAGVAKVKSAIRLRALYTIPGTDIAQDAMHLRVRHAIPGTDVA
eukprot:1902804-Rhodomonas_salina.1